MSLNVPWLRWVALPFALVGLFVRRWEAMVIVGSAAFVTFLFLDFWASASYWLALIPIGGLVLERGHVRRREGGNGPVAHLVDPASD
jgi:hypothetical protein